MKLSRSNGIAVLTFSTDQSPYLTTHTASDLREIIESVRGDHTLHALVLEGGKSYFSAGASRELLLDQDPSASVPYFSELPRIVLSVPIPTIAAMCGHAIGGGLLVGLWCDMAVLAEESLYGANFMAVGITPGMGSTSVLAEAVGAPLAREMLLTGRMMKGREIERAGCPLSSSVVPRSEVLARATAVARELAELPREALVLLKQTLSQRRLQKLEEVVVAEQGMHAHLLAQDETRSRIEGHFAAFPRTGDKDEGVA